MHPTTTMNVAVNYREDDIETARVATGTVPGSGSARTPPILLKAGMVGTYEGIGTLSNLVVAAAER